MAKKKPVKIAQKTTKKPPPWMTKGMSKGAEALANTLSGGGMNIGPPPEIGLPENGSIKMGIMGPQMMRGFVSEPGTPSKKKAVKVKPKKK
jgi:hypothetical protein